MQVKEYRCNICGNLMDQVQGGFADGVSLWPDLNGAEHRFRVTSREEGDIQICGLCWRALRTIFETPVKVEMPAERA